MATRSALKFAKDLKELRLHLCQTSAASKGVRYYTVPMYLYFIVVQIYCVISFVVLIEKNISFFFAHNSNIILKSGTIFS